MRRFIVIAQARNQPLRRFANVLMISIALPIVALAPAYIASQLLTDHVVETADDTATIDITDIDQNGTVMYTVSPSNNDRRTSDTDFKIPRSHLPDSDMIRVTIEDRGTVRVDGDSTSWIDHELADECSFTLHLSSDDPYDDQSDTFTGYIRVADEDTFLMTGSDLDQRENCGLYLSLEFEE
jgi:hypothetical protein